MARIQTSDLKASISVKDIDLIFSNSQGQPNKQLKEEYLSEMFKKLHSKETIGKTNKKIDEQIIGTWDYKISKDIIRNMFLNSEKCANNKKNKEKIDQAINDWKKLGFGDLSWPFSANGIDDYVHNLNRNESLTGKDKDADISNKIIRFRRMKEISQLKNDYIEYLVVVNNNNIIPTFGNKRGVDFYIDGISFDQKVSKSVGRAFIEEHPDDYRTIAITDPKALAKSLYEHQDADRFGSDPRFLVVYLDTDMNSDEIESLLKGINFSSPLKIDFEYKNNDKQLVKYTTSCYLVILHR